MVDILLRLNFSDLFVKAAPSGAPCPLYFSSLPWMPSVLFQDVLPNGKMQGVTFPSIGICIFHMLMTYLSSSGPIWRTFALVRVYCLGLSLPLALAVHGIKPWLHSFQESLLSPSFVDSLWTWEDVVSMPFWSRLLKSHLGPLEASLCCKDLSCMPIYGVTGLDFLPCPSHWPVYVWVAPPPGVD